MRRAELHMASWDTGCKSEPGQGWTQCYVFRTLCSSRKSRERAFLAFRVRVDVRFRPFGITVRSCITITPPAYSRDLLA